MRYSKTTAHAIVIGSAELGGIGMMDLYIEQGILDTFKSIGGSSISWRYHENHDQ